MDSNHTPNHPLTELSAFQRDILAAVSRLENPIGVEIGDALEEYYSDGISAGRLYPNLEELVEGGLLDKRPRDDRSDYYVVTTPGREVFIRDLSWREEAAGFYQPTLDEHIPESEIPGDLLASLDRVVSAGLAVPICRGHSKDGSPCGRRVKSGGYCPLHKDQAPIEEASQ